jgi:spectinomycin phosphotransferase/16S rRNA (guanine(1405)-N(7))-methyltransferase
VFTEPDDLPSVALADALQSLWGFTADSLEYQPVGFGSHHWLATDGTGMRLYATADDLAAKRRTAHETTDDAFDRLCRAFGTALALRGEAGLNFVIAPLLTATGRAVARLSERYSLVIHPYVSGTEAGEDGEFTNDRDRQAVVDMLIQIHRANAGEPHRDDFVVPHLDTLQAMIRHTSDAWCSGPYAQRAQDLLRTHARDLHVLITAYRSLARRAGSQPERMVITHGEPHAGNVIVTADGLVLVDWDTTLVAPPERDLWALGGDDASLLDYYAAATGIEIDDEALSLYRLWYDLAEVGGYLSLFHSPHEDTADTRESWKELQHFLRPAERWPSLTGRSW